MASISKRPDGRWRARYRDANGKEHAKHFDRKADAQRWIDEVTASIVTGRYVDPNAGKTTFQEYAAGWEASQVTGEAQRRIVDNALRVHLIPALGARPVASIKRADVQGFVKQLDLRLGPGSVRNVFEVLGRVLSAAVDDRVIASSPCQRISLPTETRLEVVPPTAEQVKALAEAISPRYRAAVVTLAGSGLRIGELLGLRKGDVDFLRRSVRVERQRRQNGSLGPPKTARSVRIVPLGRVVTDELAAHLAAHPSEEWALHHRPRRAVGLPGLEGGVGHREHPRWPEGRHPRPAARLRLGTHQRRCQRQTGADRAGSRECRDHAAGVQPPVARR